jgi:Tol biopolymer transport system component
MGPHGTGMHLITPTGLGAVDAAWAPNGSKIAFWAHCCDPQTEATEHGLRPSYSPQGDMIVFERDAADFSTSDIMIVAANGGAPTLIRTGQPEPGDSG